MFRRRNKSSSNVTDKLDASSNSINNSRNGARHSLSINNSRNGAHHSIMNNSRNGSRHNVKHNIPLSPQQQLRRATIPASTKPIKGILRIKSIDDSLHSVYGRHNKQYSDPAFNDSSVRSTQSDDAYIKQKHHQRMTGGSDSKEVTEQATKLIRTTTTSSSNGINSRIHRRSNSVLFTAIEIREYERTVGDNPSCSSGPPVSISWDYYPEIKTLPLDDYENYRPNRRMACEMVLSREARDEMLRKEWDISRAEIAAAIRDTIRIKNQRRQTVQNLNKDKVEEMMENASKKIFRSLLFKSSTSQELQLLQKQYMAVEEEQQRLLRQQELQDMQSAELEEGNNNNTTSNNSDDNFDNDISDDMNVVGLDIDETESEHKEDNISTKHNSKMKKDKMPIVIDEDSDYDDSTNHGVGVSSPTSSIEQLQYKGETSSEDGSYKNSTHHHQQQQQQSLVYETIDTTTEI